VDALSRINNICGYNWHFIREIESLIKAMPNRDVTKPVSILDLGCGGGGLLKAIHFWAKKKGVLVELHGVDLNEEFARTKQMKLRNQGIPVTIQQGDATDLQMEANSYDIVISSYILHHVRGEENVALMLKEIKRVAKHGWLVIDLNRKLRGIAYMWMGLFLGEPLLLIDDGIKSLRRAYTAEEINNIVRKASTKYDLGGVNCAAYKLFPHWKVKGIKG
jgi:2-polyprenyl-3-methyl-5-hydroxy-6-metoxy-1,4-benzoquinol methylase